MADRAQRPHRRGRGDQHRLGDRAGDGSRDAVGAAREGTGEEHAAVEERDQRRDDGVVGDDDAVLGLDTDRRPVADPGRAGVLEDRPAGRLEPLGEPLDVALRVELRLVREAQAARGRKGKRHRFAELRRQAGSLGGAGLGLDQRPVAVARPRRPRHRDGGSRSRCRRSRRGRRSPPSLPRWHRRRRGSRPARSGRGAARR